MPAFEDGRDVLLHVVDRQRRSIDQKDRLFRAPRGSVPAPTDRPFLRASSVTTSRPYAIRSAGLDCDNRAPSPARSPFRQEPIQRPTKQPDAYGLIGGGMEELEWRNWNRKLYDTRRTGRWREKSIAEDPGNPGAHLPPSASSKARGSFITPQLELPRAPTKF